MISDRTINVVQPVVSIIVPIYNCEKYIERCVGSLLNQTYKNIDIILINDGSTDGTNKIIESLVRNDNRVHYYIQENHGVSVARNVGVSYAKGKYLLFVDGDDFLELDYAEHMVGCAEQNQSELVVGGYQAVTFEGEILEQMVPVFYERKKNELCIYRICGVCSRLYLKSFWIEKKIQFIEEQGARGEDTPVSMYANLMAKNISVLENSGYNYVQHSDSAMNGLYGYTLFHFPFETMRYYLNKVKNEKTENSFAFFVLGVYKFLAQFAFVFSKGASKKDVGILCKYIYSIHNEFLKTSVPQVWEILRKDQSKDISLIKFAVGILLISVKTRMLGVVMRIRSVITR